LFWSLLAFRPSAFWLLGSWFAEFAEFSWENIKKKGWLRWASFFRSYYSGIIA